METPEAVKLKRNIFMATPHRMAEGYQIKSQGIKGGE